MTSTSYSESSAIQLIRGIHARVFARYARKHLAALPPDIAQEVAKATHARQPLIRTSDDAIKCAYIDTLRRNVNQYILLKTALVSLISFAVAVLLVVVSQHLTTGAWW